jgi:hypothetical protein
VNERCVLLRRDAEALDAPGFELVFFSVRCTLLGLTLPKTFSSTSLSAKSEIVQRARPGGAGLHAMRINSASDRPSNFRGRDGFSCGFFSKHA